MAERRAASVPDERVRALLARWLPGRAGSFARAPAGGSTPVYRVVATRPDETFFLRLADEPGESRLAERRVHQLLRAAGLPVPAVLAWEERPPELDRSAMLTSLVPGRPLIELAGLSRAARDAVAEAAGRDLARINRVPVRGFGWVETTLPSDGELAAEHPARAAWTAEYDQAMAEIAAAGVFASGVRDRLRQRLSAWLARPDQTTSRLAHGDFDATHIYVAGQPPAYSGLIDFGEIRGADRLYDLGHALLQDGEPGRAPIVPALLAGYREVTPLTPDDLNDIRVQAIAIGLRRLAIAHRRASPAGQWLGDRLTALVTEPVDVLIPSPVAG